MLVPKKVKHRKWHKGHARASREARGTTIAFGGLGLVATEACWVNARQIEAARRVLARAIQKGGKVWVRIFPDKPVTRKGVEVPMGGGKGSVEFYVAAVRPGRVMFEIDGLSAEVARDALRRAGHKLPLSTKIMHRS
ncbi:50S ribosomal protein L16 [Candidatus Parcubacteria bacterium]|nr:50S ribosomal protein L16 [Candidatus Parcubacteria bacterium]